MVSLQEQMKMPKRVKENSNLKENVIIIQIFINLYVLYKQTIFATIFVRLEVNNF